jgi:hypothetical protein
MAEKVASLPVMNECSLSPGPPGDRARDGDRHGLDPLAEPPVNRAELGRHRGQHLVLVTVVCLLRAGDRCPAELHGGHPPGLVRDGGDRHQRPAGMRVQRGRRPAAAAGGRRRALGQQAQGDEACRRLGGEAAGHAELPGDRGPGDARPVVHGCQQHRQR